MTIEVALLISVLSVGFSIFFGLKNSSRNARNDIEQRTVERTETNMKLNQIISDVQDIKYDISTTKREVSTLSERMASVEASAKQAHHRIDRIEGTPITDEVK